MKLKITSVRNAGDLDNERIVLRADADVDIGKFALFCCKVEGPDLVESGNIPYVYWFDDQLVKEGDLVVLYTKSGTKSEKENASGKISRFNYWSLPKAIWSSETRSVLVAASDYMFGPAIDGQGA
jgi:hypothetical protein